MKKNPPNIWFQRSPGETVHFWNGYQLMSWK